MTTRESATATAKNALARWGGRVAVLRRDVTLGTEWLTLSSHSGEYGRFVSSAAVGDSVMVGGYEAVVVEVWGTL